MKIESADTILRTRLKYDWLIYVFWFFFVFVALACNFDYWIVFLLIAVFVIVEIGGVFAYKKILRGDDVYHALTRITLSKSSSAGLLLFCMIFELAILFFVVLVIFWGKLGMCIW